MYESLMLMPSSFRAAERPYHSAMTVPASDVASVLRDRLPGASLKKIHKLLYYCQGHHLAAFETPMFSETISAWDMGPVVGSLWKREKEFEPAPLSSELGEAELNTIGYVVSRYGSLTGRDLENLTHSETPWQLANGNRRPHESARIELDWIKDYFQTAGAPGDDEDDVQLDTSSVRRWLAEVTARPPGAGNVDAPELIAERLDRSA